VTDHSSVRLARVALEVATEAAAVVFAGYRSRPAANEKAQKDLVTEYDVKSERLVRERLSVLTPEIPVVGEEQGGTSAELTWFVDPLDGTMDFVHGHPFFCVSVGAVDEKGPLAGAVVAPALRVSWWGGRGSGAFRDGAPCRVSGTTELRRSLLGTGFPLDRSKAPENNLGSFARVIQEVQGVRRCGAAAIDCCFVADGTYDAYWERALHPWDLAAGAAIALEAGGRFTSLSGEPPDLRAGNVILSNGHIHEALVALLRDAP
jgi:myo-inositol-1(or 4)-monophosphatase